MIVSKFGGSATASSLALDNVEKLIKDKSRRMLVFSAVGKESENDTKTTDLLIKYSKEDTVRQSLLEKEIIEKFERLKGKLNVEFDVYAEWKQVFNEFKKSRDKGFLISRGEYITTKMLAKAFKTRFVPAEKIFYFKNGNFDFQKIKASGQMFLESDEQIMVPGFYGIDESNRIVLLSRGGSDVSGAVLSKALNANIYENWTDVNGVYQKDPHIQNSKQIMHMSYDELSRLTESGAKVIHKDCTKLLSNTNIILKVGSILRPNKNPTIVSNRTYNFEK